MTNPSLNKLNCSLKMIILSLFGASLLAGCGIRGDLKAPPPLFGGGSTVDSDRIPTGNLDNKTDDDDFDPLADPQDEDVADE